MAKEEVDFIRKSPFSGNMHKVTIVLDMDDYRAWQNGKLIQNALPYLTADEREFLMTGITKDEWDSAFKGTSGHGDNT